MEKETPSTDKFGFDPEVQAKILALLFVAPSSMGDCLRTMQSAFFDSPIDQRVAGIILKYHDKYEEPIPFEILAAEFDKVLVNDPRLPEKEYRRRFDHILDQVKDEGLDYAKDVVKDWLIQKAYKITMLAMVDALNAKDYAKMDQLYVKAQEVRFGSMGEVDLDYLTLDQAEDKDPEWFWQDHFLKNELNLIVGIQGTGKSYFTHWLAACITTGRRFPGTFWPTPKGRVIFLSYEDPPYRVKRRVKNCGGDVELVGLIRGTKGGRMFSLVSDLPRLKVLLKKYPDTVMLIIDPVASFFGLGKADTNKGSDVRAVLHPLCKLAEEFHVTLIGVMHLNKSGDVAPIHRIAGASAFGEVARTVWLVTEKEDNVRYFSPMKLNEAAKPPKMNWIISKEGAVEFPEGQTPPPSIEEQLSPRPKEKNKKQKCAEWLLDMLKSGPLLKSDILEMWSKDEGGSETTLNLGKQLAGVRSRRRPVEGAKEIGWPYEWYLPVGNAAEPSSEVN